MTPISAADPQMGRDGLVVGTMGSGSAGVGANVEVGVDVKGVAVGSKAGPIVGVRRSGVGVCVSQGKSYPLSVWVIPSGNI